MSIEDFLDHKCDIYHVTNSNINLGYGIKYIEKYIYGEKPDLEDVDCHFSVKNDGIVLVQELPQTNIEGKLKLTVDINTDVRVNDRVVSKESGLRYRVGVPRNIRNHHIAVMIYREDGIKGAI